MVRGLYTAGTGMAVQRNKMDVLTNNVVNSETTGFKKDYVISTSFEEVMLERINDPNVLYQSREVGPYNFGTHVDFLMTDFQIGAFEVTNKSTDLALATDGFFVVETEAGERYTRSGSFAVDVDGFLVNGDGHYVLGQNGRIAVGSDEFTVAADGTVTAGDMQERLRIAAFEDNAVLRKQGDNLYYLYEGEAAEAEGVVVKQGYLEASNVSVADEMVDMISIYRVYEANQRILSMIDDTLGMATTQLGSLS